MQDELDIVRHDSPPKFAKVDVQVLETNSSVTFRIEDETTGNEYIVATY